MRRATNSFAHGANRSRNKTFGSNEWHHSIVLIVLFPVDRCSRTRLRRATGAAIVREAIFYEVIPTAKPSHRRRSETANSRLFYPTIRKRSIARGER